MTAFFSIKISKVEPHEDDGMDDTALNGIKLYCENYNENSELLSKRYFKKLRFLIYAPVDFILFYIIMVFWPSELCH